ncbi:class I SAM-dependent methyltransferase [Nocardia sp. NPDC050175]|uniref:class I SAM-dependent methyltransferase n=1 Tax=Nocardia sp. NPDC050175 TaxID=3364317 RepID=UPI00379D5A95
MTRTEGDSWDIVRSVGATALGVAAARAVETERPDALVRDEYAALFVAASGHPGMNRLIDDPAARSESPLMTGSVEYRSRFLDDAFLAATAAGVRQVVILAAGLDARAYRLAWPHGTVVFELDRAEVLGFKRDVLTEHGAVPAADRREVAVDLRDDWPAALIGAGVDPTAPIAWSAEGLLPYLPGAAHDALIERIDRLSAPGSSVATDVFRDFGGLDQVAGSRESRDTPFAEIDLSQLLYTDDRTDPDIWLADHGWTTSSLSPDELAARYGRSRRPMPEPYARMFASIQYVSAVKSVTAPSA